MSKLCTIEVEESDTISHIKELINNAVGEHIDERIPLIFNGLRLEDDRTIKDYRITKDSTLSLILRLRVTDAHF